MGEEVLSSSLSGKSVYYIIIKCLIIIKKTNFKDNN